MIRFLASNPSSIPSSLRLSRLERSRPGKIRSIQSRELSSLVRHAYRNVPFYRRLWATMGVPVDRIRTPEDLRLLPLVQKSGWEEGLTGAPGGCGADTRPFDPFDPVSVWLEGPYLPYLLELWKAKQSSGHLWVMGNLEPGRVERRRSQYLMSPGTDPSDVVGQISTLRPELVGTMPSMAQNMALEVIRRGLELRSVKILLLQGELITSQAFRIIKKGFPWARILDTYVAREVGLVAFQCREAGCYHIPSIHHILEVLDSRGAPVEPGQRGSVVITDLLNRARPLIRYAGLSDMATTARSCTCSLAWPALKRIMGPGSSVFELAEGRRVEPEEMVAAMEDVEGLGQFQITRTAPDRILVKVVPACDLAWTVMERRIKRALTPLFPPDIVSMEILFTQRIEPSDQTGRVPVLASVY